MPRVSEIPSLVTLGTDCIKKAVENNSEFATAPSAIKKDGDRTTINSELISNPFHQLRKFCHKISTFFISE